VHKDFEGNCGLRCHARSIRARELHAAISHGADLAHPNRDDSLALHESQDAMDGFFE
jgi:hypothetical protein